MHKYLLLLVNLKLKTGLKTFKSRKIGKNSDISGNSFPKGQSYKFKCLNLLSFQILPSTEVEKDYI